jgi:hypothetical protein
MSKGDDSMKSKIVISFSIFVLLFAGAWLLNEKTKRKHIKFVITDVEPIADYIVTPIKVEAEEVETWDFKPREYIKIRKRTR